MLTSCDTTESSHGHAVNNPLQPFRGHLDTLVDQSVINDIEYLVIGFALFEPQVNSNHTSWIEDCLHYCKTSNLFPNLKSVYVLYENTYINFTSLTDHYPTYGVRLNYFLLRSEGTEEKAIGIDNSYDNTWFRKAEVNLGFNYNKAVWMIGDITNRPHKFPLLYKFHTENKLDVLDYSLTYRLNDQTNEHFRVYTILQNPPFPVKVSLCHTNTIAKGSCVAEILAGHDVEETKIRKNKQRRWGQFSGVRRSHVVVGRSSTEIVTQRREI